MPKTKSRGGEFITDWAGAHCAGVGIGKVTGCRGGETIIRDGYRT